jgi:cation diffusion facilitator CzcD-associated flavoprotein CzcO
LQQQCADRRYLVLESQPAFGGTWYTHSYPGLRSDSDLFTFGYRFKPWTGAPIANAAQILRYLGEVIEENGIAEHIRYQHKVVSAAWHSDQQRWILQVLQGDTGETREFSCNFLWMCQGYYRHGEGFTPEWPGMADFQGRIVHPQTWPEDLHYAGKRVVVIGSGATAATLVPAIANQCAHVTMLQRSPTYFRTAANANDMADLLRPLGIPQEWIHEIVRRKILADQSAFTRRAKNEPEVVRQELVNNVRSFIGDKVDVDKHFAPRYRPWQQRLAFIPDADLFGAIAADKASVVTDEIDCFTAKGLKLKSGAELEADIIVTATGLALQMFGGMQMSVDGKPVEINKHISYKGLMFDGLPNFSNTLGYTNASWTLKADLIAEYVCRLLKHMDKTGTQIAVPVRTPDVQPAPLLDMTSGYVARVEHLLPKGADRAPWKLFQNYAMDRKQLHNGKLEDGVMQFSKARGASSHPAPQRKAA